MCSTLIEVSDREGGSSSAVAYWGFAANVNFMTVIFNYALRTNRIVITANPDRWNYAGKDCSAGWECYFRPLTNCTMADAWEPYTTDPRFLRLPGVRG